MNEHLVRIGAGTLIGPEVALTVGMWPGEALEPDGGWVIRIGDRVNIGRRCALAGRRRIEIGDDDIEMHRRPVSRVVAADQRAGKRRRAIALGEQIDRSRRADELDRVRTEAPADRQPERLRVEANAALEVVDIDVDKQLRHRLGGGRLPVRLYSK